MHQSKSQAFTLVELIVVITILAILGTIGFISFLGFSSDSRDTRRISDVAKLDRSLELSLVQEQLIPVPTNSVNITGDGSIFTIQWDFNPEQAGSIGVHGEIVDPLTDLPYPYAIDESRTKYQISAIMESSTNTINALVPQTYAQEFSWLFTKGDKLGIVLESGTLNPIHRNTTVQSNGSFEILTETGGSYDVYLGQNEVLSWTKEDIREMNPRANCKRLQELGYIKQTWEYQINPNGEEVDAYCHVDHPNTTFYQSIEDGDFENPTSGNWENEYFTKVNEWWNTYVETDSLWHNIVSNNYSYVRPDKTYRLSWDFKSAWVVNSRVYYGFIEYDKNFEQIRHEHIGAVVWTDATLMQDVEVWDTVIVFEDRNDTTCDTWENVWYFSNFWVVAFNTDDTGAYNDLPNRDLSWITMINWSHTTFLGITDNGDTCTLELSVPVTKSYEAWTTLRKHTYGGTYNYRVITWLYIPSEWTSYSWDVFWESLYWWDQSKFRRGTRFVRPLILANYQQGWQWALLHVDNLHLVEVD